MEQSISPLTGDPSRDSPHPPSSYTTANEDPINTTSNSFEKYSSSKTPISITELSVRDLQSRVQYLEKELAGKDAALHALSEELDAARDISGVDASIGPLALSSETDYKAHLAEYITKLQELSAASAQKDEMIQRLQCALKQRVAHQEAQDEQIVYLKDLVSRDLQEPQRKLMLSLKEKEQELKQKTAELTQCKSQSADEVQFLMLSLEQLQQRESKSLISCKLSQEKALDNYGLKSHYENKIQELCSKVREGSEVETVLRSKVAAYELESKKLHSDLCSLQLSYEAEVSSLKEELQKTLLQCNKEQEVLETKSKALQQELNDCLKKSSSLEAEVQSLHLKLKEKADLCQKQKDDLLLLQTQYSLELSTCHQTVDQYKVQLEKLQSQFHDTLAENHAEYVLSQEQLRKTHANELHSLQQELKEKHKLLENLDSTQLAYSKDLITASQELEQLKNELTEKLALVKSQENKICVLEQKLSSDHQFGPQKVHSAEKQIRDKDVKIQEVKEMLVMNEKQLLFEEQHGVSCKEQLNALSEKLTKYQLENGVLKQKLKEIEEHHQTLLSQLQGEKLINDKLKIETESLNRQVNHELKLSLSLKESIDALECKLNELVQEKSSQAVMLENERQWSHALRNLIDDLFVKLLTCESRMSTVTSSTMDKVDGRMKSDAVGPMKSSEYLDIKDYIQKCKELETMLLKDQRPLSPPQNEIASEVEKLENLCTAFKVKIENLESELKIMADVNSLLKEQQKTTENELSRIQMEYSDCKSNFQERLNDIQNRLALKEEELSSIVQSNSDIQSPRDQSHIYNQKVKELLLVKSSLEDELDKCGETHKREVSHFKEKILGLEEKLQKNDSILILLEKCHQDLTMFKKVQIDGFEEAAANLGINRCHTYDSLTVCEEFPINNCSVYHKLKAYRLIGIQYLEELLHFCEESLNKQTGNEQTLALHLSKSNILVEKLKIQLEEASERATSFSLECEKLKAHSQTLEKQLSEMLPATLKSFDVEAPTSFWILQCKELEKKNDSLLRELHIVQLELEENKIKMSFCLSNSNASVSQQRWKINSCHETDSFTAQLKNLQSTVEGFCAKVSDEAYCMAKENEIGHGIVFNDAGKTENSDSKIASILETASKCCQSAWLQSQLQVLESDRKLYRLLDEKQSNEISKLISCVEESWHENSSLQQKLQNALLEVNLLRLRMNRVETFHKSQNEKKSITESRLLQVLQNLDVVPSCPLELENSSDSKPSINFVSHLETSLKIVKKMVLECDTLLAKSQEEVINMNACEYLQSEALNLRRLFTSLQDLQKTFISKSGPVVQAHVDLLTCQLHEKQTLYEGACDTIYALEAELRDLEDKKLQLEENLLQELEQHKIAAKSWQLKADLALVKQSHKCHSSEDLNGLIIQLNSLCLKLSTEICFTFERITSTYKEQLHFEMAEHISALELRHQEQLKELTKHSPAEHNWKDLEMLHQQELAAVNADHEYKLLSEVLKVRRQLTDSLNCSLQFGPVSVRSLCLQLIKQDLTSKYHAAISKVAVNFCNEWEKQLSTSDLHLETKVDLEGTEIKEDALCKEDYLNLIEDVAQKSKLLCEQLHHAYSSELQFLVSSVEKNFNNVFQSLQNMNEKLQDNVNVAILQEELRKSEERHRFAIESMTARHNAEETRLRLILSSTDTPKLGDSNESSLVALRKELEEKHKREMENLRTYFEQKCADFEKHYSEEVFSQHSRKMSECSSASESEIVSEMYYAGPAGSSSQSHLCDSLGESSFKDFEEQTNFEKLFRESREELESMRLALESRHQGELEAQREVYETKVEELVRNMSESHDAELKLQLRKLQKLEHMENDLKQQLNVAQDKIKSLQMKLDSLNITPPETKSMSPDSESKLQAQVQLMTDALKKKETESSAQIATLKVKLRDYCEALAKQEKEILSLKAKHEDELISIKIMLTDRDMKIEELQQKLLEYSDIKEKWNEQLYAKLKEEMNAYDGLHQIEFGKQLNEKEANNVRRLQEQRSDLLAQHELQLREKDEQSKQALSELKEKYDQILKEQKALLDSEYSEYLDFVKKCADETKAELLQRHSHELKELSCQHERQLLEMKSDSEVNGRKFLFANSGSVGMSNWNSYAPATLEELLKNRGWNDSFPKDCLSELLIISKELESMYKSGIDALVVEYHRDLKTKEKEQEAQLDSVREECERYFHLQLEEARADIVQALEHQIQQLLNDENDTSERPQELQELENKLSSKYQVKIDKLNQENNKLLSEMEKRHAADLEALRKSVLTSSHELKILRKERDCLRNVAASLRDVVAELVRYFMSCEDELNSTLMNELAKFKVDQSNELLSITNLENSDDGEDPSILKDTSNEMSLVVATPTSVRRRSVLPKRVRFAPDVSSLLSFIDDDCIMESVGLCSSMRDASLNFHEELDRCLARLRCESAALLEISKPPSSMPSSLAEVEQTGEDQLRAELENVRHSKAQLLARFSSAQRSQKQLQEDNDALVEELNELRQDRDKLLAQLQRFAEARHEADVVAEGYGEGEGEGDDSTTSSSPRATTVEELQDKARTLLLGASDRLASPDSSQQLQLPLVVEELCRDWERLSEEARRKQDDLQQQVEVADKQLRSTRAFLDEQAAEREQERDDFTREINRLQEQLRDKGREWSSHQQINREVEALENQLKESQTTLQEAHNRIAKLDVEQRKAVEKIWTLRDIICDLESQLATKAQEAATTQSQNDSLQCLLEQQGRTHYELAKEMEALQLSPGNEILTNRICQLEEELRKHRLQAEQFGDLSAVLQLKSQLRELELSMESRTKEMECAHASTAAAVSPCLSSPSEDVSIRETLEAMRAAAIQENPKPTSRPCSPIVLPTDELTHLQEQWQRHLRMDDAVLKRIRDLGMHLNDTQAEKDVLAKRLQEQMHLVSKLEAKLDEHRCKFEAKQLEATAPLRSQVEELEVEMHNYMEALDSKERQIKSLQEALHQVELNLTKQEAEVRKNVHAEHNATVQLKNHISKLSADNEKLQAMLKEKYELQSSLPVLFESMLADKNADIDHLEKQVLDLSKQVEQGSQYIATPCTTVEFEYREEEKVRAHVELSPVLQLKRSLNVTSVELEKTQLKDTPGVMEFAASSSIQPLLVSLESRGSPYMIQESPNHVSADDLEATASGMGDIGQSSSVAICCAENLLECTKHIECLSHNLKIKEKKLADSLTQLTEKAQLIQTLEEKCRLLEHCDIKLREMPSLEKELKAVREELLCTVTSVNADKEFFETQLKSKDAEIEFIKKELRESQDIILSLQQKIQEAKQFAVSPNRSLLTTLKLQTDLEATIQENSQLKENLACMKIEVEKHVEEEKELRRTLKTEQDKNIIWQERSERSEEEFIKCNKELKCKQLELEKLQIESKQLNSECIALKQQLSIPVNESLSLSNKLEAERRFSKVLQEELSIFKNKVQDLEQECQELRKELKESCVISPDENRVASIIDENKTLQQEILQLKSYIEEISTEKNRALENTRQLEQDILQIKTKSAADLNKMELDKQKALQNFNELEVSSKELQSLIDKKTMELKMAVCENELLSKELTLLRNALKNVPNQYEFCGLADEDYFAILNIQKQLKSQISQGRGDTVLERLAASEVNVFEIRPENSQLSGGPDPGSLDDLTGMVQQELDISLKLDDTLLQSFNPLTHPKVINSSSKAHVHLAQSSLDSTAYQLKPEVQHSYSQSQLKSTDIEQLQSQLITLLGDLNKERASVSFLEKQVYTLHSQFEALQKQDSDLIEDLRLKLANAIDVKNELQAQLHLEVKRAALLEQPVHPSPQFSDKAVETSLVGFSQTSALQEKLRAATFKLQSAEMEKDATEKKLRRLQEVEVRRSRKRAVNEVQHKDHIDQLKASLLKKQQEYIILQHQLSKVTDELKLTQHELKKEREAQFVGNMPVVERLKEMNEFLDELFEENRKLTKQIEQFTDERKVLLSRNAQLEQKLSEKQESNLCSNERFSASRPTLAEMRPLNVLDPDVEDRVNHLFGRYLRSDSYKKALIWQKRYLLSVISGYNECENITSGGLVSLKIQHNLGNHNQQSHKFRSVVFALIAIQRMRFLVDRWHRGKRIGTLAILSPNLTSTTSHQLPQVFLGRPFTPPSCLASTSAERIRANQSQSPPTLERPHQYFTSQHARVSTISDTVGPTHNLSEYVKRFDVLNQQLDVFMSHPPK